MRNISAFAILSMLLLAGCTPNNKDEWANLDYAKIARDNYQHEFDNSYKPPSVNGCVDDDLYNCSGRGSYH